MVEELPEIMTYYPMSTYEYIGNEISHLPYKKYNMLLRKKGTKLIIRVPYGDSSHGQYRDSSGIGKYSHLNHLDKERQFRYWKRHRKFIKPGYYSPGYASMQFLWS